MAHRSRNDFFADYESKYRKTYGPLRPFSIDTVDHLFKTATESLRDWMRLQLQIDQPDCKLAAIAGVQTFGHCLVLHPHLHILSASGLFDFDSGLIHRKRSRKIPRSAPFPAPSSL